MRCTCDLRVLDLCHGLGIFLEPFTPLIRRHELFNPGVPAIHDKHASSDIDRDAVREVELPFAVPESTPLGDEIAFFIELLDTVIAGVRYVDIAGAIDRNAPGRPQLTRLLCERAAGVARFGAAAPLGQQLWKHIDRKSVV